MRGHVRQRGKTWSYIIDLGNQKAQRCDCGARFWLERKPLESCSKCGGELRERVERRQREQGGFKTRKETQLALAKVMNDLQQGNYIEPAKVNLRDYLTDEWLPAVKATIKPSTYLSYQIHVERHISPAIGSIPLQKLSGATLNAFYGQLLSEPRAPVKQPAKRKPESNKRSAAESGSSPQPDTKAKPLSSLTVRKIHTTLHKALADAVRWSKIPRNPADAADPPRSKSGEYREIKTWTAEQLRGFLESVRETRLYPLWLTLATTGMRRGEALGLRWEDVDVENSRLSIRQNRVSVGYEVKIGKPKTGHGRNVSLDPGTLAVLKAFGTQQKKEHLRWPGYVNSGYVFVRENGEPYHPDLISQAFQAAVKASKQPRIRLHDLRHTHATLALSAGVHPKVVSERLGHATITITLDTYSHAIPALAEEAAAKVAALFMPS